MPSAGTSNPANGMVSRPTLIKGLEYDHAIVLDAGRHDPTSLYVALTRGRNL
jgi:DNA helicase IV